MDAAWCSTGTLGEGCDFNMHHKEDEYIALAKESHDGRTVEMRTHVLGPTHPDYGLFIPFHLNNLPGLEAFALSFDPFRVGEDVPGYALLVTKFRLTLSDPHPRYKQKILGYDMIGSPTVAVNNIRCCDIRVAGQASVQAFMTNFYPVAEDRLLRSL